MWSLLQSESGLIGASAKILRIPAGVYSHLLLRWSGTNQAGQTAGLSDLGMITLKWRDYTVAHITATILDKITSLSKGVNLVSSVIGDAFDISVLIPFRNDFCEGKDWNVLGFEGMPNDNIEIPGLSAVVFASCNFELFGLKGVGNARYVPYLSENTVTLAASDVETLTEENIGYMLIDEPTNIPTNLKLSHQSNYGDIIDFNMGYNAGEIATNILYRLESSSEDCIIINMDRDGTMVDAIGRNYKIHHVASASNDVTYSTFKYILGLVDASRRIVENTVRRTVEEAVVNEPNAAPVIPQQLELPGGTTGGAPRIVRAPNIPTISVR